MSRGTGFAGPQGGRPPRGAATHTKWGSVGATYNHLVPHHTLSRPTLPVWERLAAWLAFLAVAAALWAPVSMLAQDVRSGKLSGICSVNTASSDAGIDSTDGNAASPSQHCDLCGSAGLVLPPLPVASVSCVTGTAVAMADIPATTGTGISGLPFSRAPPAL